MPQQNNYEDLNFFPNGRKLFGVLTKATLLLCLLSEIEYLNQELVYTARVFLWSLL